jgi:hypothetical protein
MPTTAGIPSASATIAVDLRDETLNEFRVEIRRLAGREIVRQHQNFGVNMGELLAPLAEQVPQ